MAVVTLANVKRSGVARGLLSIMAATFLGLLFGAILIVLIATNLFGFHILTVQSNSMVPEFARGDIVVTKPVSLGSIERGDVIVYRAAGGKVAVAHRVVQIRKIVTNVTNSSTGQVSTGTQYVFGTKGDANPAADTNPVQGSDVLGEVWFTTPNIGFGLGG